MRNGLTKSDISLLSGKLPDDDVATFDIVVNHMLCLRADLHNVSMIVVTACAMLHTVRQLATSA